MLSSLTPLMIWAATYFLHSSLLLGGVWLWFRWREPSSHALREAVWKLAAVGGFVTASLQLGLHIESPINTAMSRMGTLARPLFDSQDGRARMPILQSDSGIASEQPTAPPTRREQFDHTGAADPTALPEFVILLPDGDELAGDAPITPPVELKSSKSTAQTASQSKSYLGIGARFRDLLTGIIAAICGAAIALSGWGSFRLVYEHSEFRRRLSGCRVISTGAARDLLNALLDQAGTCRSVTLLMAEDDLEPGACGWLRWQIVLPSRALKELPRQELRALLAHELAHLVRGDQWWLLVGRLLTVCLGWQPLNRMASREWQRASEYLCDAWAIQRDVERLSLARCLTTVAEWRLQSTATLAGFGSGNRSNLTQRVERLVEDGALSDPWQRYSRRHLLIAVGSLVAVGMVGYAPAATWTGTSRTSPTRPVVETLTVEAEAPSESPDPQLIEDRMELIPTRVETITEQPLPDVLVSIELIREIRQQVTSDMVELIAELDALERAISQLPPTRQQPLWGSRLLRFRQRLETIHRLRDKMLIPL